jgi:hypothetical protein
VSVSLFVVRLFSWPLAGVVALCGNRRGCFLREHVALFDRLRFEVVKCHRRLNLMFYCVDFARQSLGLFVALFWTTINTN